MGPGRRGGGGNVFGGDGYLRRGVLHVVRLDEVEEGAELTGVVAVVGGRGHRRRIEGRLGFAGGVGGERAGVVVDSPNGDVGQQEGGQRDERDPGTAGPSHDEGRGATGKDVT